MEQNEKIVEQFAEAAQEAGMQVVKMEPQQPIKQGLNGWVVAGVAVGGVAVGGIIMAVVPKVFKAIKNRKANKKALVDQEAEQKKAELVDEEDVDKSKEIKDEN